jgi:hypothetical protein
MCTCAEKWNKDKKSVTKQGEEREGDVKKKDLIWNLLIVISTIRFYYYYIIIIYEHIFQYWS